MKDMSIEEIKLNIIYSTEPGHSLEYRLEDLLKELESRLSKEEYIEFCKEMIQNG